METICFAEIMVFTRPQGVMSQEATVSVYTIVCSLTIVPGIEMFSVLINTFYFDSQQIMLQQKGVLWIDHHHSTTDLLFLLSIIFLCFCLQLPSHSVHTNVSSDKW